MAPGKRNARKRSGSSNNQVNKAGSSNSSSKNKAVSSENKDTDSNPAMEDAQLAQALKDPLDLEAEAQEFVKNVMDEGWVSLSITSTLLAELTIAVSIFYEEP